MEGPNGTFYWGPLLRQSALHSCSQMLLGNVGSKPLPACESSLNQSHCKLPTFQWNVWWNSLKIFQLDWPSRQSWTHKVTHPCVPGRHLFAAWRAKVPFPQLHFAMRTSVCDFEFHRPSTVPKGVIATMVLDDCSQHLSHLQLCGPLRMEILTIYICGRTHISHKLCL